MVPKVQLLLKKISIAKIVHLRQKFLEEPLRESSDIYCIKGKKRSLYFQILLISWIYSKYFRSYDPWKAITQKFLEIRHIWNPAHFLGIGLQCAISLVLWKVDLRIFLDVKVGPSILKKLSFQGDTPSGSKDMVP